MDDNKLGRQSESLTMAKELRNNLYSTTDDNHDEQASGTLTIPSAMRKVRSPINNEQYTSPPESDKGLLFVTTNNPAQFKDKTNMEKVRKKAMNHYLEERPRSGYVQKLRDESNVEVHHRKSRTEPEESQLRKGAPHDIGRSSSTRASSKKAVQPSRQRRSARNIMSRRYQDCVTLFQEILLAADGGESISELQKRSLQRSLGLLRLWGQGNGLVDGSSDLVEMISERGEDSIASLIVSIYNTLYNRLLPLITKTYSTKDSGRSQQLVAVIARRELFSILDSQHEDSDDDFDPVEDNVDEMIEDLKVDVQCLLDTGPLLKPFTSRTFSDDQYKIPQAHTISRGSQIPQDNSDSHKYDFAQPDSNPVAQGELFLSFVTKGPESMRGMSMNKALKRYHRERDIIAEDEISRSDDDKELWRGLRLKRNEKGQVVLFPGEETL